MNNKTRWFVCVQLSIFAHYYVLTSVCSEVQAQNLRINRETLVKTLGVARRAAIDIGPYFEKLALPPLSPDCDNKIELGSRIKSEMTELARQVQNDLNTKADWKKFRQRQSALLIIDTAEADCIDRSTFVYADGRSEIITDYIDASKGTTTTLRTKSNDQAMCNTLIRKFHELPLQAINAPVSALTRAPAKAQTGQKASRGAIYLDYQGNCLTDLLSTRSDGAEELRTLVAQASR